MAKKAEAEVLAVEGREVRVTNPGKPYFSRDELSPDGVLHTRLQQVLVKRKGLWWIEAYHNVDVKRAAPGAGGAK